MLMSIRSAPAAATRSAAEAITSGSCAEQLHRDRVLVRMDPQQLAAGALVAVVDRVARDHLRDGQSGAVALGLQAHEPVADPGQRREHDAVGDRHAAEASSESVSDRAIAIHGTNPGDGPDRRAAPMDSRWCVEQVPGLELFDAHTHLGQNDPDGMKQTADELLAALAAGARPRMLRVPDARARRLPAGQRRRARRCRANADGLLVPFCRVNPHDGAVAEAERASADGAQGIKLHPRAEQFTLDHPDVRSTRRARQRARAADPDPRRPRDPGARPARGPARRASSRTPG